MGSDSYKAVDRCLGPGDLWSEPLDLPWAIVDGAWADKDASVLDPLRGHGTKLLVDTAGWRYRLPETFGVDKMTSASWAPERPLDLTLSSHLSSPHKGTVSRHRPRGGTTGRAACHIDLRLTGQVRTCLERAPTGDMTRSARS